MSAPRFYVEKMTADNLVLSEAETHHALQSKRLSVEDEVTLFDGYGREADARILAVSKDRIELAVQRIRHHTRPIPVLTLAVAPPKEPRQASLIEKCTELGVAVIQPLSTERSVAEVSEHRLEKWRRTSIEAAKQSGQCWLPIIREPRTLEQILVDLFAFDQAFVAISECNTERHPPKPIVEVILNKELPRMLAAFVGPEGGWTDGELNRLLAANVIPVSLGPNTLRIETAAIALASGFHALLKTEG